MSNIENVLREKNFRFNKQFGQNFITDTNLLDAMVALQLTMLLWKSVQVQAL